MDKMLTQRIWFSTFFIVGLGLLTLYSASFQNVRVEHVVFYDQLVCALVGFFLMLIMSRMDYRRFFDISFWFYGISVLLLVLVLFSGRHALGAQRWFVIGGISFQPSEIAKLALILALGRYFSQNRPAIGGTFVNMKYVVIRDLLIPLMIVGVPMLLVFKQPDLGTAILFFGIFLLMLFMSGLEKRVIAVFLGLGFAIMPLAWHILKPYQKDRLLVFLNPNIDPLGAGYTIIQSRIGVGSGQIWGKGWLSGTQNQLNFLPERHTDFIFSVIGEEWGLVGALLLLLAYFLLIDAGLRIAEQVNDKFGMQVTVGIVGILTLQVLINIGMVIGLCPVVGITLPMISYGRSSFMIFMFMMGFLLSLSRRRTVF